MKWRLASIARNCLKFALVVIWYTTNRPFRLYLPSSSIMRRVDFNEAKDFWGFESVHFRCGCPEPNAEHIWPRLVKWEIFLLANRRKLIATNRFRSIMRPHRNAFGRISSFRCAFTASTVTTDRAENSRYSITIMNLETKLALCKLMNYTFGPWCSSMLGSMCINNVYTVNGQHLKMELHSLALLYWISRFSWVIWIILAIISISVADAQFHYAVLN